MGEKLSELIRNHSKAYERARLRVASKFVRICEDGFTQAYGLVDDKARRMLERYPQSFDSDAQVYAFMYTYIKVEGILHDYFGMNVAYVRAARLLRDELDKLPDYPSYEERRRVFDEMSIREGGHTKKYWHLSTGVSNNPHAVKTPRDPYDGFEVADHIERLFRFGPTAQEETRPDLSFDGSENLVPDRNVVSVDFLVEHDVSMSMLRERRQEIINAGFEEWLDLVDPQVGES